jgi:DNA repair photolyase
VSESEQFDRPRAGTGTREWAEVNFNIGKGCANDCLYCYAAGMACNPFFGAWRPRSEWSREELSKNSAITTYPKREGVIMFPSTHDVTPFYLPHYIRTALVILAKGNRLLITTKPRLDCVTEMIQAFLPYRDQVLFRFTIGSTDDAALTFWEPGAPLFPERWDTLCLAYERGFQTSVSCEPMLAGSDEALRVVLAVYPFVSETIWVGRMNNARSWCDMTVPEIAAAVEGIRVLQCDGEIRKLVRNVERLGLEKVRWKDSIKAISSGGH